MHAGTCSNPTGNEADVMYNGDFHTYQFCNGTQWMSEGAIGASGGLMLISTQTASSSASLQFTSLPSSYNTLFLNCADLLFSNSTATVHPVIGEGAGPTWESGAHYTASYQWSGPSDNGAGSVTTAVDWAATGATISTTAPYSMRAYMDNVGSSTAYKNITWSSASTNQAGKYYEAIGVGYWNNDTNPITGIQISPSAGNIVSGTCSLYGLN